MPETCDYMKEWDEENTRKKADNAIDKLNEIRTWAEAYHVESTGELRSCLEDLFDILDSENRNSSVVKQ